MVAQSQSMTIWKTVSACLLNLQLWAWCYFIFGKKRWRCANLSQWRDVAAGVQEGGGRDPETSLQSAHLPSPVGCDGGQQWHESRVPAFEPNPVDAEDFHESWVGILIDKPQFVRVCDSPLPFIPFFSHSRIFAFRGRRVPMSPMGCRTTGCQISFLSLSCREESSRAGICGRLTESRLLNLIMTLPVALRQCAAWRVRACLVTWPARLLCYMMRTVRGNCLRFVARASL